jgi:aldose 1-epimerase
LACVDCCPLRFNILQQDYHPGQRIKNMASSPEIVTIADPSTGSEARILAGLGFNCYSWRPTLDDGPREMLWADPNFTSGQEKPSRSGIPLLFPFPGRIGQAKYSFGGRDYQLEPNEPLGNAIHGFALSRPWRVVEQSPARVTGEFQASVDDAAILDRWPSDFRIRVSYEVRGRELLSDITFDNPDDGPLPCGFGTHTYFRLPLAERAAVEETELYAPVSKVWELRDMLATGSKLPITPETDLGGGPLAGRKFDTSYTGLQPAADGLIQTRIHDPKSGRTLTQVFDQQFTQCVVFTPPHREAICMEPYTCIPDSFRLAAEGYETGLRVLGPGESFATTVRIAVS